MLSVDVLLMFVLRDHNLIEKNKTNSSRGLDDLLLSLPLVICIEGDLPYYRYLQIRTPSFDT